MLLRFENVNSRGNEFDMRIRVFVEPQVIQNNKMNRCLQYAFEYNIGGK